MVCSSPHTTHSFDFINVLGKLINGFVVVAAAAAAAPAEAFTACPSTATDLAGLPSDPYAYGCPG